MSSEILKEMISNFITQDNLFPQGLDLKKQERMISSVFGNRMEDDRGRVNQAEKEKVIQETREVLNGLIKNKIGEYVEKGTFEEGKQQSKSPKVIKDIASMYKLSEATIDYQKLENEEKQIV